ncbi:MAG: Bax inhibitor-1/YccA family protein [Anaerolineae bacterium]|nr:Bax inhibitor-1/YccA family protein [Anaerolineae bacterium]
MSYGYQREIPFSGAGLDIGETFAAVMRHVYVWMCLGLLITALTAIAVVYTPLGNALLLFMLQTPLIFYGVLIGELVLVWGVTARMAHMSVGAARVWFLIYAILNGVTLSAIFLIYTTGSIALTFVATASLFGVMAVIGYTTRMDLSKWGGYLLMALVGLLIASVVNMFLASSGLEWILTYAGLLLFIALTVYDTQRIKRQVQAAVAAGDSNVVQRVGLLGALSLYLDFINLFLRLLRILGRRRRS